jgi:pseudouridine-5'-phosphate glycosidase
MSAAGIQHRLTVSTEVAGALAVGRAVVALESTLISHGLPYPQNIDVARASEAAVRSAGATPATIAIHDGRLLIGLDDEALELLAHASNVFKAARPSLAIALTRGGWAATTVSATMIAAYEAGIDVFATGGIGGVHRGALGGGLADPEMADRGAWARMGQPSFDISSDLEELARTPMAVVCAGPKAILDVAATIQYLETRGVPVLAVGVPDVPGFYSRSSGVPAPASVVDITAAAEVVRAHLLLGLGSAILVCVPPPAATALSEDVARAAVDQALAEAKAATVGGPALTPWLLARIAELTAGASIRANTALIINDAGRAAELAVALRSPGP